MPQSISDASTPLTEFSTERALVPLKEMSNKPHYVGTEEHQRVREFIISELEKLGLSVEIQEQEVFNKQEREGTKVYNIIAKIKGSDNSKALMLSTHYDSGINSAIGASDAASGVVTILEGIRAYLASGKQPKNDIIILITDGEEIALLGATAFAIEHPLAREVGLILNFEARGSGGPSYMLMETNGGNKNLIKEFQKANPEYPVSTSLLYDIYKKVMPNATDLTAFREGADIEGFNFAFIGDHFDYHTAQDNYERLDRESLEHQGSYLMPLLRYFADADLSTIKAKEDYVYFSLPIIGIIYYPSSWIMTILLIVTILFFGLVAYGISKKKIILKEIFIGFIPFFGTFLISGLFAKFGWELLKLIYPQYKNLAVDFPYNGYIYIAAFTALTLAICFIFYKNFFTKHSAINLLIAPIFVWLIISVAAAIYLQGAAFFVISVIFGIISLAILMFLKTSEQNKALLISIASIPILVVFAPNVRMFPVGLGIGSFVISVAIIVLLFGLLVPVISKYMNFKLGYIFFAVAIVAFITASFQSSYTIDRKKSNSINYVLNIDDNKATWGSYDNSTDAFTQQFFGDDPIINKGGHTLEKNAEIKPIAQPKIDVKNDTIIGDFRHISFDIVTQRNVRMIQFLAESDFTIKNLSINESEVKKDKDKDYVFNTKDYKYLFAYYFAFKDSVLNIQFSIPKNEMPKFIIYEWSFDLHTNPHFNIKPRADYMMPSRWPTSDAIILVKKIEF